MAATPAVNITIPQGADFSQVFTAKETDGSARDLTGYTGSAKIKKHPGATSSSDFTVGITSSSGQVSVAMTSGVTVGLDAGRYYYDVKIVSGIGTVSRLVEGMAFVTAGITT
tara:strand:+ start:412 stop:747 length:336 start_codon:yes stop_codon:yes gene_type:complete